MSYIAYYLHFVWNTKQRLPWLTESREAEVFAVMAAEAHKLGCQIVALNGMPDHVHLLIQAPSHLTPMTLMQQVKGVSSRFFTRRFEEPDFAWQEGYGLFSVSRSHVGMVRRYIQNQKQHHAQQTLWQSLEITEPAPSSK